MNNLLLLCIAILCGIAIPIQGQFIGILEKTLGIQSSILITYGTGALLALLLCLITSGLEPLRYWATIPWYVYSAGALGLVIVGAIGYVVPRLGLTMGFTIIVATQFILGSFIDHFGWLGAQPRSLTSLQIIGVGFLLLGMRLVTQ